MHNVDRPSCCIGRLYGHGMRKCVYRLPEPKCIDVKTLRWQHQDKYRKVSCSSCLLVHCEAVAALHVIHHAEQAACTGITAR